MRQEQNKMQTIEQTEAVGLPHPEPAVEAGRSAAVREAGLCSRIDGGGHQPRAPSRLLEAGQPADKPNCRCCAPGCGFEKHGDLRQKLKPTRPRGSGLGLC